MKAALRPETGLRTGRLLSDVFVFEYAGRSAHPLVMITDGGLNIAPDVESKAQLIRNAVEVAHALGNPRPKDGSAMSLWYHWGATLAMHGRCCDRRPVANCGLPSTAGSTQPAMVGTHSTGPCVARSSTRTG